MNLIARLRSLWRSVRRMPGVESDMNDEFRSHIELRTADLVRGGLPHAQAARQARLEFGSRERYKDEGRESRGLRRIDALRVSWLDFKLGFRMLARYPGLTIVGALAMAFAIWLGSATFELMTQVLRPTLPLDEGDRIVGVITWDAKANEPELRVLHDFLAWRGQVKSIEDFGAARNVQRNLITSDGVGEPIRIAEVSASAFRVTRVPPLLGRGLVDADEVEGAPAVVVLGYDVWQRRFGGDPSVIGRTVRLGRTLNTVVGVMPEGFEFPVNHALWAPLRPETIDHGRRTGPAIAVFGRLAAGVSREEAHAEVAALGARAAADFPDSHEYLRPEVVPYVDAVVRIDTMEKAVLSALNLPMLMLLVLICGNVALLMFARAATREAELAVRTALGASRSRIVMQLFAEALVLGALAAVIGLVAVGPGLEWVMRTAEVDMMDGQRLPFWFHSSLSPTTVVYAIVLTLGAAVIAGVVPALKATRGMGARLQQASAGAGGMRLGGIWTAVIITQVAMTVAFPTTAYFARSDTKEMRAMEVGFPAQSYLTARLEMDREPPPGATADTSRAAFLARYQTTYEELARRIAADGSVGGVTYGDRLPKMSHPRRFIELNEGGMAPIHPDWPAGHRTNYAYVDPDFFDVLQAPVLMGRNFTAGDLAENAVAVIVNQSFVRAILGDRNPIGRRMRYVSTSGASPTIPVADRGAWYEIVGVVPNLGMDSGDDGYMAGVYHPASPAAAYPLQVGVHVKGATESFVPRLRALASEVDPTIRLYDVAPVDDGNGAALKGMAFWFQLFSMVSAIALVLSLAGIYAVMSFTVAQRTREIGIRVALGASQRRVIAAIFKRPIIQVAIGIVAGATLVAGSVFATAEEPVTALQVIGIVAYALAMMGVCMLACIVPTRRALRVEPTEALRGDG